MTLHYTDLLALEADCSPHTNQQAVRRVDRYTVVEFGLTDVLRTNSLATGNSRSLHQNLNGQAISSTASVHSSSKPLLCFALQLVQSSVSFG